MGQARPEYRDEEVLRSRTYALLGALFADVPDAGLLSTLAAIDAEPGSGPVGDAWAALGEAARAAEPEAVDDEYHDLFIGIGRGEVVPYGSWYLSGFMMGRPLADLRGDLAALGFEREEGVKEPEDHVAALFDVMSVLSDPDNGENIARQQHFYSRHLAPWIERFMQDVRNASAAHFYRAVAELGERVAVLEKQYLGLTEGAAGGRG